RAAAIFPLSLHDALPIYKVLLLTESIFSMDGDAAPLVSLAELAQRYDAGLVVDEAHAVGVYGPRGGGLIEELELQSQVLAKLGRSEEHTSELQSRENLVC